MQLIKFLTVKIIGSMVHIGNWGILHGHHSSKESRIFKNKLEFRDSPDGSISLTISVIVDAKALQSDAEASYEENIYKIKTSLNHLPPLTSGCIACSRVTYEKNHFR